MRVYATEADLQEWTGEVPPPNAVGLIRAASSLVEDAAMLAYYPTGAYGLPRNVGHTTAFKEATITQAAYWAANELDPDAGGLSEQGARVASSKSIKGASVSYDTADAAITKRARAAALSVLCSAAFTILRNAGLVSAVVR